MRADQLTDPIAYHGEGPVWDHFASRLLWVDMLAGDVMATAPDGSATDRHHVGDVAACVVPRHRGGFAVATERGFVLCDESGGVIERLPDVWDDPSIRMNDGGCDPRGRFFCGTMAYDAERGRGTLYRLDLDRSVHTVLAGVTVSNGIAWSDDGDTVFYVDSPTGRIDAFDFEPETGTFGARRTVVEIAPGSGTPDGMTLDADGGIWVALWGGRAVHRYAPDGQLDEVVELPVLQPSSCAFGGDDLRTLFISTSAERLEPDEAGPAGALFVARPGVTGRREPRCAL